MPKTSKNKNQAIERTVAPVSYGIRAVATNPRINGSDKVVIRRREFVGTATNGGTFGFALTPLSRATPGYDLNPATSELFPWLSRIAPCYERFRFNKVKFHFIPSQPTSTAGRFYAAVDYDYDDLVANTKAELMGNATSVEAAVWQECELVCNPQALNRDLPYRYVSSTGRTSYVEQRTAYSGFMMCAFDTTVGSLLMDIWVEYEVELVTPVNDPVISQFCPANYSNVYAASNVTSALGTGFIGFPLATSAFNTTPASPIKVVRSGSMGVPVIFFGFGGTNAYPPYAMEIGGTQGKGKLDISTSFNVTGQTPATVLNNVSLTDVEVYAFDFDGLFIGSITNSPVVFPPSIYSASLGVVSGEVSVASKFITSLITLSLEAAYLTAPTLKYLVPFISNSNAAFGAGNSGFGVEYRKTA